MIPALDALERLREGNRRFVSERSNSDSVSGGARRREIVDNQTPFAIVLGCSDSRVPAEIVFDQGLGDLFVIRVAGNIVAPSQVGSVAVRYPRGLGPGTPVKDVPRAIPVGKAELLQHSSHDRVAIFALGALVPMAEEIARKLEGEGVSAAVVNARFTKPIDVEMLEFFARSAEVIVTLEDHVLRGGFGSAVLEELNTLGIATPVVRIGWPDQFIEHGKLEPLRAKYGLTPEAALEKLRPLLRMPQKQPV